ncbi:MAG TPA: phosphoglycerate mutase, partial [Pedococcus sp.]|nr:phosphoglycerate mutase [Pedococcus sp.]
HFQSYIADPASVSAVRYGTRHTFLLAANVMSADLSRFVPAPQSQPEGDAAVGGGTGGAGAVGEATHGQG